MWRLLLGTMGVKSLVQGLNAAATAGFEPRTVWSEVRRRNRLATAPPLLKLYCFTKANFRSAAPACIMCINPTNRMRGHDEARRREASVQRSRPEVGRSIYIYIYIPISWQRRRWPPNWGLAEARPNKWGVEFLPGHCRYGVHPSIFVQFFRTVQ